MQTGIRVYVHPRQPGERNKLALNRELRLTRKQPRKQNTGKMADAPAVDEVAAAKEAAKRAAHENRALRKWIGDQLVEPHNFALSVPAIAKCLENGKLYGLIQVSGNALRAYCHDNGPAESLRFLTGLGLDEDTKSLGSGPGRAHRH